MNAYGHYYKLICALMMVAGVTYLLDCFFWPTEILYIDQHDVIPISFVFMIQTEQLLMDLPMIFFIPLSLYFWKHQFSHPEFVPRFAFILGIILVLNAFFISFFNDGLFYYVIVIFISIALVIASISVVLGHVHSLMRIIILLACVLIVLIYQDLMTIMAFEVDYTVINFFTIAPAIAIECILLIVFGIVCIFPEDYPSVRLNRAVRDFEMALPTARDMTIAKKDLDALKGLDLRRWHHSPSPEIEREITVPVYGSNNMLFTMTAIKWYGDDSFYLTFHGARGKARTVGQGFKIIHIAYDNTDHIAGAAVVRFYTDDGFFFRLAETEERPKPKPRFKSLLASLVDD